MKTRDGMTIELGSHVWTWCHIEPNGVHEVIVERMTKWVFSRDEFVQGARVGPGVRRDFVESPKNFFSTKAAADAAYAIEAVPHD